MSMSRAIRCTWPNMLTSRRLTDISEVPAEERPGGFEARMPDQIVSETGWSAYLEWRRAGIGNLSGQEK